MAHVVFDVDDEASDNQNPFTVVGAMLSAEERIAIENEARYLLDNSRYADAFYRLHIFEAASGWVDAELKREHARPYFGNDPSEDEALAEVTASVMAPYRQMATERADVFRAVLLHHAAGGAVLKPWVDVIRGKAALRGYLTAAESVRNETATPRDFLYAAREVAKGEQRVMRASASPEEVDPIDRAGVGLLLNAIADRHLTLTKERVQPNAVRNQLASFKMPNGLGPILESGRGGYELARRLLEVLSSVRSVDPSVITPNP